MNTILEKKKKKEKEYKEIQSAPEAFLTSFFQKMDWFDKYDIKTQYTINGYRVDFFFPNINLIIEIDSKVHKKESQILKDKFRDFELKKLGYDIYRIDWEKIKKSLDSAKDEIIKLVKFVEMKKRLSEFKKEKSRSRRK